MDAINRTDRDTRDVLGSDARITNYVSHCLYSSGEEESTDSLSSRSIDSGRHARNDGRIDFNHALARERIIVSRIGGCEGDSQDFFDRKIDLRESTAPPGGILLDRAYHQLRILLHATRPQGLCLLLRAHFLAISSRCDEGRLLTSGSGMKTGSAMTGLTRLVFPGIFSAEILARSYRRDSP